MYCGAQPAWQVQRPVSDRPREDSQICLRVTSFACFNGAVDPCDLHHGLSELHQMPYKTPLANASCGARYGMLLQERILRLLSYAIVHKLLWRSQCAHCCTAGHAAGAAGAAARFPGAAVRVPLCAVRLRAAVLHPGDACCCAHKTADAGCFSIFRASALLCSDASGSCPAPCLGECRCGTCCCRRSRVRCGSPTPSPPTSRCAAS